ECADELAEVFDILPVEVREVITFARGIGCVNGATIRLTHDAAAGTLGYRWFNPKSGALRAVATLTRKK
ncbi:MAG: hypothetical protein ACE5HP_11355, partial [Gemmatimonadota bacterium]